MQNQNRLWLSIPLLVLAGAAVVFLVQNNEAATQSSPRHELKNESGEYKYTNRLIHAESPYLLQHAHNPVDWYPWGEEAFEKARKENKPIFLSIGYSTCHWCHVMERESFSDPEIAEIMNENFVCIKVDREERPDVDRVYMQFVQATTGSGGWPLSVWLTPDLKPFTGGTYFPPEDRFGRPGFPSVLTRIAEAWETKRDQIVASADSVISQLQKFTKLTPGSNPIELETSLLDRAYDQFQSSYQPDYGGFGDAPKFPRAVTFNFLLRYHARTDNRKALEMTLHTLRQMAQGGIHDHLGGGFHRYSTDRRWHVPHFEKMLYNQAQLACSYLEAYQITDDPFFANVVRDILRYVRRDMTGDQGQFYSAEDADSALPNNPSEHAEGAFYVWETDEIEELLDARNAAIFNYYYGVEKNGNVQQDPHGEFPNKNVLIVSHSIEETAEKFELKPKQIRQNLEQARQKLFDVRSQRPRPSLDDKTLTAWNGLMISAFARAHQILEDPEYLDAAADAAAFIRKHLYDAETGNLLRRYRAGNAGIDGYADDYAYLIQGLLDLYEASFDVNHLSWAVELQKKQNDLFWDDRNGGFYTTTGKDQSILLRMKEPHDGAKPSPNSVALLNLLRLAQMTDHDQFRQLAETTLDTFATRLTQAPTSLPQMLVGFDFHLDKPKQILIAGAPHADATQDMLRAVHERFIPNKILMLADGGSRQEALADHLEFIKSLKQVDGQPTAYICEDYVCQLPTTDLGTMKALLEGKTPSDLPSQ